MTSPFEHQESDHAAQAKISGHALLHQVGHGETMRQKLELLLRKGMIALEDSRRQTVQERARGDDLQREVTVLREDAARKAEEHAREIEATERRADNELRRERSASAERERLMQEDFQRREERLIAELDEARRNHVYYYNECVKIQTAFEVVMDTVNLASRTAAEENASMGSLLTRFSSLASDAAPLQIEMQDHEDRQENAGPVPVQQMGESSTEAHGSASFDDAELENALSAESFAADLERVVRLDQRRAAG